MKEKVCLITLIVKTAARPKYLGSDSPPDVGRK